MLTASDLERFRKSLRQWFTQFQRDLPWRRTKDAYRVWLSEVMLQQTRVAAAIPYYERFLEQFPTIQALAEAPPEEVLRLWSGLGYYVRARNLQHAAQQIVAEHNSVFPRTREGALALPGIGSYTAAAILSIAYGQQLAVLDGNVARVLARLQGLRGDLRTTKNWQLLQQTANTLLDPCETGDWNQAMMELGATLCTPRSPKCLLCPVAEFCQARKLGLAGVIPLKRKGRDTVDVTMAALVLVDPVGHTLLLPPPKATVESKTHDDVAALLSRMWHFPTVELRHPAERSRPGPVSANRGASSPAAQQLRKFVEVELFSDRKLTPELFPLKLVRHAVTYRRIVMHPFRAEVRKLPNLPGAKSVPLSDLSSLTVSNLTRKVARSATQA